MKKNWMKKLSAALFAATLFASGFATKAFAAEGYTVTPFTYSDFDDLTGEDFTIGEDTQGTITVNKFITEHQAQTGGNPTDVDPYIPVSGVNFTLVKVGQYATVVKNADGTASTMIGLDEDFLKVVYGKDEQGEDIYNPAQFVVDIRKALGGSGVV